MASNTLRIETNTRTVRRAVGGNVKAPAMVTPLQGAGFSVPAVKDTVTLNRRVNGEWITYSTACPDRMLWDSAKSVFGGAL